MAIAYCAVEHCNSSMNGRDDSGTGPLLFQLLINTNH